MQITNHYTIQLVGEAYYANLVRNVDFKPNAKLEAIMELRELSGCSVSEAMRAIRALKTPPAFGTTFSVTITITKEI